MSLTPGTILDGRYRIDRPLGSGGSGTVFLGWDLDNRCQCAIKHVRTTDPDLLDQLATESRLMLGLRNPHVPRLLAHVTGLTAPGQALVMEFVDGEDLSVRLEAGALAERDALPIARDVLEALAAMHALPQPVIHRDVKPGNIRIDHFGNVWLLDLGIGQHAGQVLAAGAWAGTPEYAAPEQFRGAAPDVRSDLYSFGATLYHMLAGAPPPSAPERLAGARLELLQSRSGAISDQCAAILARTLALDPNRRFQKAAELHRELERLIDPGSEAHYARAESIRNAISERMSKAIVATETVPPQRGVYGDVDPPLPEPVQMALAGRKLYLHQAESIRAARDGLDVVVATGTGSGKSVCFNVPVLERCLADPRAHALFLYPTKALINDQAQALQEMIERMGTPQISIGQLHGDLDQDERREAKTTPPRIALSTPDFLHWMLARHPDWRRLFSRLQFLVIDEVHEYRGAFGTHLAYIVRRLLRLCRRRDAELQIICASATIGNPEELVERLTGRRPLVVDRNGAQRPRRHYTFWEPLTFGREGADSGTSLLEHRPADDDAVRITIRAVDQDLQVITFGRARQQIEQLALQAQRIAPKWSIDPRSIVAYRGGYTREEREAIELSLREGSTRAVFTTNALELGIDIGGMQMAVLTGFPGTRMSFHQQAGRAGRRDSDGHVVFIATPNPLNYFYTRRPEEVLERPPEAGVIDLDNALIAEQHLRCMAREEPLQRVDLDRLHASARRLVESMLERGVLAEQRGYHGNNELVYVPGDRPHSAVNLRGNLRDEYNIVCHGMSEPLGKIQQPQLGRETHPQAIYYHAGNGYLVTGIDQALNEVNVVPYSRPYYTKPKIEAEVTIIEELAGAALTRPGSDAVFGRLRVDEHVAGYKIYEQPPARKMIAEHALSKPVTHLLNTKGFVLRLDPALQHFLHDHAPHDPVADFPDPLYDALHGLEHLLVELLPSVALCDRRDIAGWVPQDPFTDLSARLAIYDATEGGIGLAEQAFKNLDHLLVKAMNMLESCPCTEGCPRCLQTGWCHLRNDHLSKVATRMLLLGLLGSLPSHA